MYAVIQINTDNPYRFPKARLVRRFQSREMAFNWLLDDQMPIILAHGYSVVYESQTQGGYILMLTSNGEDTTIQIMEV